MFNRTLHCTCEFCQLHSGNVRRERVPGVGARQEGCKGVAEGHQPGANPRPQTQLQSTEQKRARRRNFGKRRTERKFAPSGRWVANAFSDASGDFADPDQRRVPRGGEHSPFPPYTPEI
eukprot:1829160-Rhodomonas_salina.1